MIRSPTRITNDTQSLIDIIAVSNPAAIKDTTVVPFGIADHELIGCVRKINHIKFQTETIKCRDYKSYDPVELRNHLASIDWNIVFECTDVNRAWVIFGDILSTAFDKFAPMITKRVKGKCSPWLSADIKFHMNIRDRLMRRARKSKVNAHREEYKRKRNSVNIMIRNAKSEYTKSLLRENAGNPDGFWATIKRIFPSKSKTSKTEKSFSINSNSTSNPNKIVNGFCSYFSAVVGTLKKASYPLLDFTWRRPKKILTRTFETFRFGYVSVVEVTCHLKKLKRKKAAGHDNLPAGLLKDSADVISIPLAHIINLSLRSGVFPTSWKVAKILPLYKSGASDQFGNYRPISILPVISKVVEKIVHKRLVEFLTENNLLLKQQFGFRAKGQLN